ncbi:MAG: metallopeptidase TldD-related protein [Proteobacteria bacterium]|nr:metallopeptidase TldD-related protein [Pseudomonadota bacterium]
MTDQNNSLTLLDRVLGKATAAGAEAADAVVIESVSLSLAQRLGEREHLSRSESADLGLRVFIGARQAIVSSSDSSERAIDELVERAVAMARSVPEDPYCGLADPDQLAADFPDLEGCDDTEPDADILSERAAEAEDAARAVPGISNSEGAEASWGRSRVAIAATNGFSQSRAGSRHSISVAVLAGEGTKMERDYDYATTVHAVDLPSPAEIGRSAGEKTINRLNPQKASSASVPVVYDPRVSNSLVRHLAGAVNGTVVARGTTFLKDKTGEQIFPAAITIIDDPLRPRGLGSKGFDGEGVGTKRLDIIEAGVLTSWILDLRSARQLGLSTTGHAGRGISSPPSPSTTNLYMQAGAVTPQELMADIKAGLYVTEMMGFGVNTITGDYSRGASGFWIENGGLAYPVNEVTIAGNLEHMFAHLTAADDLEFRYATNAPTLRVEGMTVAGR